MGKFAWKSAASRLALFSTLCCALAMSSCALATSSQARVVSARKINPPTTYNLTSAPANAGSPVVYTFTRSSGSVATTFSFVTGDGTAKAGVDYASQFITFTLAPGVTSQSFSIQTYVDNGALGKTLIVYGAVLLNGQSLGGVAGNIVEPSPSPVTYSLSGWSAAAGTPEYFTISRSDASVATSVDFETVSGTAMPGSDYLPQSLVVNLAVGVTSQTVAVTTYIDHPYAGKTLNFTATIAVNGTIVSTAGASIVEPASASPSPSPSSLPSPMPTSSPVPSPSPSATPTAPLAGVLSEGDSISVFWGGNHTGIYAANRPTVIFHGKAVGGAAIDDPTGGNGLIQRFGADVAYNPKIVTVLIGANDLSETYKYATTQDWLNKLWSYTAMWHAVGAKVYVATVLPQCVATQATNNVVINSRRVDANNAIRAAVGNQVDGVIDFAADPVMGPDAAACDSTLYYDGLHPTDGGGLGIGGQGKLATIYLQVLDLAHP